jgi:serine/threonine-protein kinase
MLGEIFMQREQFDLAAQAFQQARDAVGGTPPLDLVARIAEALEGAGRFEEALQGYEALRRRDLDYPNVAARIEELRKRIGRAEQVETSSKQGRYEILGELGRGGMGVVLKARDRRLGRIVALKRLPENLRNHETAVRLFLREARAAAALNHPNIVTVFDADEENGNYFITMELLEGFPLNAILRKRGRLSAKDVARLGVQVAAGLQYAHERRIVHRDIKTANLFFTRDRVVKIMDFGLAKMMEEVRRSSTVIGGTPYYMAPEQAVGDPVDHRADLYSFGVTLFELLTGSVPFASGDVTHHHRHTAPPDPREKAPGIPDPLAALVLALLRKRPDDRPATTAEVGRLLQELAGSL